jgi:hypothetical protein
LIDSELIQSANGLEAPTTLETKKWYTAKAGRQPFGKDTRGAGNFDSRRKMPSD